MKIDPTVFGPMPSGAEAKAELSKLKSDMAFTYEVMLKGLWDQRKNLEKQREMLARRSAELNDLINDAKDIYHVDIRELEPHPSIENLRIIRSAMEDSSLFNPENREGCYESLIDLINLAEKEIISLNGSRGDVLPSLNDSFTALLQKFREMACANLLIVRRENELAALAALHDAMNNLKESAIIKKAPWISGFVERLTDEIGRATDPYQIVADIAISTGARNAANRRHGPSARIRRILIDEAENLKNKNPKLSKNAIAKKLAPFAMKLNEELDAGLCTLTTLERAESKIRDWLKPSKLRITK